VTLSGRDIVCVGFSDWNSELLTNEQHLLVRMARANRILFVESLGLRRPQVAGRDLRRMARRLARGVAPPRAVDGLHVLSPLVLPLHGSAIARRANGLILPRLVRGAIRRLDMRDIVLWSFVPQAEVLLDALRPARVLYYIDDDHAAKKGIDAESFRAAEQRFARRADAVMASAPELAQRMRLLNDNVHYAPNVADTALFATALEPGPVDTAVAALPGPRIVFTGAIVANKLDLALIAELAAARPDWSFAFVGPVGPGDPGTDVSSLRGIHNVHLLGHRPYERLPDVLRASDAAIMPYRTDGEMRSVFPMKTYEYLAAGLPVVATRLPALADVSLIEMVGTGAQMAAALEAELAADTDERRRARSAAAQPHSWEARIQEIAAALDG
jgi:glycosyltransferase involved in cell wall biosynthesis